MQAAATHQDRPVIKASRGILATKNAIQEAVELAGGYEPCAEALGVRPSHLRAFGVLGFIPADLVQGLSIACNRRVTMKRLRGANEASQFVEKPRW